MFKIKYKKMFIHPSFIILLLWFFFFHDILYIVTFIFVVYTHEFGHYIVAKKCGYKLDSCYLAPYGISLNYKDKVFERKDEIFIGLAGPLMNFCLSLIIICFWWINPTLYSISYDFVEQSLLLGSVNLLPCYPLDGGRIFVGIFSQNISREKAIKVILILNYIFSFVFFILFLVSCFISFNPSFCLFSCFLFMGSIETKHESKYKSIALLKKKNKNFSSPFFLFVNYDVKLSQLLKHIENNRLTVFIVNMNDKKCVYIDEYLVKKYALKFSINNKIGDCFKQDKE